MLDGSQKVNAVAEAELRHLFVQQLRVLLIQWAAGDEQMNVGHSGKRIEQSWVSLYGNQLRDARHHNSVGSDVESGSNCELRFRSRNEPGAVHTARNLPGLATGRAIAEKGPHHLAVERGDP